MKYWIVVWDSDGVEFLEEITEHHPDNWAKTHLFDSIKESKRITNPMSFNLQHLVMRAQMNAQRFYEIYVFTSSSSIEEEDIRLWCRDSPQHFADWVRKNHSYKVYDNRRQHKPLIV